MLQHVVEFFIFFALNLVFALQGSRESITLRAGVKEQHNALVQEKRRVTFVSDRLMTYKLYFEIHLTGVYIRRVILNSKHDVSFTHCT